MHDGVGMLLECNGMYLILQRQDNYWECPKGHKERGESDEQTLLRELKEETGITHVAIAGEIGMYSFSFTRATGESKTRHILFYKLSTTQKDVKVSLEHTAFAWVNKQELFERIAFEDLRSFLRAHINYF